MNHMKIALYMLASGIVLAACSQGRQDPLAVGAGEELTEGKLTMGGGGPNLVVEENNKLEACQEIDEEVFTAYARACTSLSSVFQNNGEALRMLGQYSGYVVIDGSQSFTNEEKTSLAYDFKLTFFDYSDSAAIFMGGSLRYQGAAVFISPRWIRKNIIVQDSIKFAGAYSGSIKFGNFQLPTNDQGNLSLPFEDLSDGEKCFMICALVLAANDAYGPVLCFWDEPDNYLSLSEVGHFVLALRKAFQSGGQFIATSHNPEAIRRFSDENTLVLHRKNHLEPTIVRPLSQLQVSGDLVSALIRGDVEP